MWCGIPFSIFQPGLQNYQERNQPEFIQRKAREKLEAEGYFKDQEPAAKKKRPGSVEPLDRAETASPLPELPEDLRQKQVGAITPWLIYWKWGPFHLWFHLQFKFDGKFVLLWFFLS